jgi:hypothetical protein
MFTAALLVDGGLQAIGQEILKGCAGFGVGPQGGEGTCRLGGGKCGDLVQGGHDGILFLLLVIVSGYPT